MCLPLVQEPGIVPLALTDLFANIKLKSGTCLLKLSYLEIYNEMVRDLLSTKVCARAQGLLLVEDPERGVITSDLSEYVVTTPQDVGKLLQEGNTRRTMAPTGANQFSSRSHAILQLTLEVHSESSKESGRQITFSKLCLIDLAGSERAAATENRGTRLLEGANINRSLLALGNCINILSDPEKSGRFVPYRDSKLTRLLKDALGGKTRTVMLACVSPNDTAFEETLHTLKYAERAQRIKVSASRNIKEVQVHVSEYKSIIAALRAEVESLKEQIRLKDNQLNLVHSPKTANFPESGNLDVELRRNFEEFWEIKQSINEIETLNAENKRQIHGLVGNLEYVRSMNNENEETRLKIEINRLHDIITSNEHEIKSLISSLQANLKTKTALNKQLSGLQSDQQRDILQLEVTVRSLKLEKMDLYVQNEEMRQQVANSQKISEEKERMIVALRLEVEEMKKQIGNSPLRLSEIDVRSEGVSPHSIDTSSSIHMHSSHQSSTSFTLSSPQDHSESKSKPIFLTNLHQVRALRKFEKASTRSESAECFISGHGSGQGSKGEEVSALLKDVQEMIGDDEAETLRKMPNVKVSLLSSKKEAVKPTQKTAVKTAYSELLRARSTSNSKSRKKGRVPIKATPVKPQVGHLANLLATLRGIGSVPPEEPSELKPRPTPMVVVSLKGAKAKS